jgi:aconitate hydratase A / 2-methylisocitrate dehydratase
MSKLDTATYETFYANFAERVAAARTKLGRPLTYAEKILFAHLPKEALEGELPERKKSYVGLYPDRVAMQDATAQMALLQFMHANREEAAVPSTVHCDHLIQAHSGAEKDLLRAYDDNREVYDFLKSVSARYKLGFWKPGAGIIHQVVLENYAFPGGMMIGTDSHTPNAGGLGMVAIGVGGADSVDVMVGEAFDLKWPGLIGVELTGELSGWASAKDVILKLCSILTVKGGTGHIVEFFGPGTKSLSCTGKGTVANMGAEHGATTSCFPYDDRMGTYLRATERGNIADLCDKFAEHLRADPEVEADPGKFYDRVVKIDLSALEAHLVGPHTPDLLHALGDMGADCDRENYPKKLSYGLIGSCTNSSYEDMGRAAHVAAQARKHGAKLKTPLMVTPGSDQIFETIKRDGQMTELESLGATVLANACGPCIGQWKREGTPSEGQNSIVTSFNRNFRRRNDGNADTLAFIGSPETVIALSLAGRLDFNPATDELEAADGTKFKLDPPEAPELPANGFVAGDSGYIAPPTDNNAADIVVDPKSTRIQLLEPFSAWDGNDMEGLVVLLKAVGKCTTDHISPAGPWLRFRGHLDNISDNMFIGANNAFSEEAGTTNNVLTGDRGKKIPEVARAYKAAGQHWVAFGDENYGEGSSREHAAMSPRFLGARAVVAKSFARIAETNLKKQGVLGLTFGNNADYDKVQEKDRVAVIGLGDLAPGKSLTLRLTHEDGSTDDLVVDHTLSQAQIDWFKAGSSLNALSKQAAAE